ncbi:MAG: hypothetical protein B7Y02_09425 [Rhodobacterales bacterium 17-64-5]|nr:MAG: hypothetical protein B7Z31_06180 [Rhodobacterales bacterium 12-65-15]OZA11061.1 MAG: hypothetical protein B7Y02_09425 [Rhodobacterales bacterium 17-64-5]
MLGMVFGLSACATKFRSYNGPEVTQVQIHKADRKLYLFNEDRVLKSYDVALGFAPVGPKQFEGDGKTPEGLYYITHRNPQSKYHLSLGISYPNEQDIAYAKAAGQKPGGDIFIHGGPNTKVSERDWTFGCIAVTDREIEQIYAMVNPGTPIYLLP